MLGLIAGAVLGLLFPTSRGRSASHARLRASRRAARLLSSHHAGVPARLQPTQQPLELPDALDLMTISVESGLSFDAALAQVARNTTGPLAKEFFRVLQEMQIGWGRAEAMRAQRPHRSS